MTRRPLLWLLVLVIVTAWAAPAAAQSGEAHWPQWRGPTATGASADATPPLEWSETENIRWKIEVPGRGSGSPVIWGDQLFLLTAVPTNVADDAAHEPRGGYSPRDLHQFMVMAIDRHDGSIIWERTARENTPHEATHGENGSWASSSAVTNGELVFASFESEGLYAYTMDGALVWENDFGDKTMRNQFGEGTTPALHGDRLVVVWDHQGQSFVAALDAATGEEVWRTNRDEIDSWATPLIVEHGGGAQIIVSGRDQLFSYDLENGDVVWYADGMTMNPIPSPVAADGLVIIMAGYRGNDLKAVDLSLAKGDITGTDAIVWAFDRDTPYVPSPLLYEDHLYFLKRNNGLLSVFDARTGTPHYQLQRLPEVPNIFASPVGAAGRVYLPGRDGTTLVIRHGGTYEVLAANTLADGFDASPALVGDTIYLRGYNSLYAIGEGGN
ncbi:MAG: PQQ-binding-like beta-propeller repeat protein [Vicinamibacterales bacterium]|nr:hypothetical protein [Acidobacteriota bacterium]MDP6371332.1 PQQ-binding-like beta-propeller repeat protein [Vicinamibacterales bacterium]MDP6609019.1 PQQ-binding-like beta-propeller repeat protein [Vicinamibacterales bacterium]MDP7671207.1 PQQ-binding-like beta-propeller repeat protein [Vicinamibacterales bacterium]HJO38437.1 PQQ-binding-like beta-propeller repeat protein [Vicinamibacterales bacterium]